VPAGVNAGIRTCEAANIRLNLPPVKMRRMDSPFRRRDLACAAHQTLPSAAAAVARHASSGFLRRSAIVLLGVALLGAASTVREFDISIRDRRVEGDTTTIRVKRGDTVLLRWRTDEAVSLHVHGYDLKADLAPASPGTTRFEAGVAGRFPITAHEFGAAPDQDARQKKHREVTLLYLEVLPE
jgi:hypothetical protein